MLRQALLVALLACPGAQAWATASFANVLSSQMVLQRDKPLRLWGTAAPGEAVRITFHGQSVSGSADNNGRWLLTLGPFSADAVGQTVTLQGASNTVTLSDVVLGDVWLFSGQSNMEFPLNVPNFWSGSTAALPNGATDALNANIPDLRVLHIASGASRVSTTPLSDVPAPLSWAAAVGASNSALRTYSALAFYFCRDLQASLNVPIGMIGAAYGGCPVEAYLSLEAIQAEPSLAAALPTGTPVPGTPHYWPTGLYNGEIHPLTKMAIKGIVFDQGESNTNLGVWGGPGVLQSTDYTTAFSLLIKDWRARFGEEVPFIFVQLQNTSFLSSDTPDTNQPWADNCDAAQNTSNGWAEVRWGQSQALDLTRTAMSVNVDLNPWAMFYSAVLNNQLAHTYHPPNKEAFATRLLPWAKALAYGLGSAPYTGPRQVAHQLVAGAVQVDFDSTLSTTDSLPARGFMLGDAGGTWVWADSVILSGSRATVSAVALPSPTRLKYAWSSNPSDTICSPSQVANLSDASGAWLAAPFQTLDEPVISVTGKGTVIRDNDLQPTAADGRDFGDVDPGAAASQSFSIFNTGALTLNLTGGATRVRVAGPDAADFSITAQPAAAVAGAGATSFTVSFQPLSLGARNAVLQIPSNDPNRTPYFIHLKGHGGSSAPGLPVLVGDGSTRISSVGAVPNPNPGSLMLRLEGPADRCLVAIYSAGLTKVAELKAVGRSSPGWLAVPMGGLDLPNGFYSFSAVAERGGQRGPKSPLGRFYLAR